MLEIRHTVPGRVRLGIPALREEPTLGPRLVAALRAEKGVREVRANAACASIVVHFEPDRLDADAIDRRVRSLLGASPGVPDQADPVAAQGREPRPASAAHGPGVCSPAQQARDQDAVGSPLTGSPSRSWSLVLPAWAAGWRAALAGGRRTGGAPDPTPGTARATALGLRLRAFFGSVPTAVSGALHRRRSAPRARATPPRDPRGAARKGGCSMLCRLHLRLVRWMVRTTLRCWREEMAGDCRSTQQTPRHPVAGDAAGHGSSRTPGGFLLPVSPDDPIHLTWREAIALLRPILGRGSKSFDRHA